MRVGFPACPPCCSRVKCSKTHISALSVVTAVALRGAGRTPEATADPCWNWAVVMATGKNFRFGVNTRNSYLEHPGVLKLVRGRGGKRRLQSESRMPRSSGESRVWSSRECPEEGWVGRGKQRAGDLHRLTKSLRHLTSDC